MAQVQTFRAWRYDPQRITNMASVLAPPYDVISAAQHADYSPRSPYNIVHLTLGGAPFSPDPYLSRYPRAADYWHHWRDQGIFTQEQTPALYVYEQDYLDPLRGPISRRGYIAAVKLQDYEEQVILPHEQIRPAVRSDRLGMMRACQCTFSQVFALFTDANRAVDSLLAAALPPEPLFEVTDDEGVVHRMWLVTGPATLEGISAAMADKQIVIADGHHRYAAALAYRDQMRAEYGTSASAPWEYTTMFLCNVDADALTILPSHRLIRELPAHAYKYLRDPAAGIFTISQQALPASPAERSAAVQTILTQMYEASADHHIFGLYTGDNNLALLQVPRGAALGTIAPDRSEAWRKLDVAVLHRVIIETLMQLSGAYAQSQKNIFFTRSAEEAIGSVDEGESAVAFLINPPTVADVMNVAIAGEQMPQKGTHFYPKPLAGVAIYDLRSPDRSTAYYEGGTD